MANGDLNISKDALKKDIADLFMEAIETGTETGTKEGIKRGLDKAENIIETEIKNKKIKPKFKWKLFENTPFEQDIKSIYKSKNEISKALKEVDEAINSNKYSIRQTMFFERIKDQIIQTNQKIEEFKSNVENSLNSTGELGNTDYFEGLASEMESSVNTISNKIQHAYKKSLEISKKGTVDFLSSLRNEAESTRSEEDIISIYCRNMDSSAEKALENMNKRKRSLIREIKDIKNQLSTGFNSDSIPLTSVERNGLEIDLGYAISSFQTLEIEMEKIQNYQASLPNLTPMVDTGFISEVNDQLDRYEARLKEIEEETENVMNSMSRGDGTQKGWFNIAIDQAEKYKEEITEIQNAIDSLYDDSSRLDDQTYSRIGTTRDSSIKSYDYIARSYEDLIETRDNTDWSYEENLRRIENDINRFFQEVNRMKLQSTDDSLVGNLVERIRLDEISVEEALEEFKNKTVKKANDTNTSIVNSIKRFSSGTKTGKGYLELAKEIVGYEQETGETFELTGFKKDLNVKNLQKYIDGVREGKIEMADFKEKEEAVSKETKKLTKSIADLFNIKSGTKAFDGLTDEIDSFLSKTGEKAENAKESLSSIFNIIRKSKNGANSLIPGIADEYADLVNFFKANPIHIDSKFKGDLGDQFESYKKMFNMQVVGGSDALKVFEEFSKITGVSEFPSTNTDALLTMADIIKKSSFGSSENVQNLSDAWKSGAEQEVLGILTGIISEEEKKEDSISNSERKSREEIEKTNNLLDEQKVKEEEVGEKAKENSKIRRELVDSDTSGANPSYAHTYQSGFGEKTTEKMKVNKKTGEAEYDTTTVTNYLEIENKIIAQEKQILRLKQERNTIETTDKEQLIAKNSNQQEYLDKLNEELRLSKDVAKSMWGQAEKYPKFNEGSRSNIAATLAEYQAGLDKLDGKQLAKKLEADDKAFENSIVKMENSVAKFKLELSKVHQAFSATNEYKNVENAIASIGSGGTDTLDSEIENAKNALLKLDEVVTKFKMQAKGQGTLNTEVSAFNRLRDSSNVLENIKLDLQKLGYSAEETDAKVKNLSDTITKMKNINFKDPKAMTTFGEEISKYDSEVRRIQDDIKISRKKLGLGQTLSDSPTQQVVSQYNGYVKVVEDLIKATDDLRRAEKTYHDQKKLGIQTTEDEKNALADVVKKRNELNAQFLKIVRSGFIGDKNVEKKLIEGGISGGFETFLDAENRLQLSESQLKNSRTSNLQWSANKDEKDQKAILTIYDQKLKIIKQLEVETSKLNDLERKSFTTENTNEYFTQYDKVIKVSQEARKALNDIYTLRRKNPNVISAQQSSDALHTYTDAKKGSKESIAKLDDAKYRDQKAREAKTERDAQKAEEQKQRQVNVEYEKQLNIIKQLKVEKDNLSKANEKLNRTQEGNIKYEQALEKQKLAQKKFNDQLKLSQEAYQKIKQMTLDSEIPIGKKDDAFNLLNEGMNDTSDAEKIRSEATNRMNQLRDEKEVVDELKAKYKEFEQVIVNITKNSNGKHSLILTESMQQANKLQTQISDILNEAEKLNIDTSKISGDAGLSLENSIGSEGAKLIDSYISKVDALKISLEKSNSLTVEGARALADYKLELRGINDNKNLSSPQGMLEYFNNLDRAGAQLELRLNDIKKINDMGNAKNILGSLEEIPVKTVRVKNAIQILRDEFQKLRDLQDSKADGSLIKDQELAIIEKATNLYKDLNNARKGFSFVPESEGKVTDVNSLIEQMDKYAFESLNVTKMIKMQTNANGDLIRTYTSENGEIIKVTGAMSNLSNGMQVAISKTKGAVGLFGTFKDVFKQFGKYFAFYFQGFSMVTRVFRQFREGFNVLKDFDDSLVTISYTMNVTQKQLESIGDSAIDTAKKLSASLEDTMAVYKIYANMNTTAEELQQLATPTIVLSNLSGANAETAADQIQAVVQQFDIAAEDSDHIVDVYDKISANIAVDYSKILERILETI